MKQKIKHNSSFLIVALFLILAFGSEDENRDKNMQLKLEDNFCNHDYYSNEVTVFGESGRKEILFRKNEYFKFKNTVTIQDSRDYNGTNIPSNRTDGFWTWEDSIHKTIRVDFKSGNNMNYTGIWKFSDDFKSVSIPPYEITLFRYTD